MGINSLWPLIESSCTCQLLTELKGKTIAIDLSGWIRDSLYSDTQRKTRSVFLKILFYRISHLANLGIKLVFVIDRDPPAIKPYVSTYSSPCKSQRDTEIFRARVKKCKELLDSLGIVWIQSCGDAKATCAFLNKNDYVDGCMSQDSDIFLYGAVVVYKNYFGPETLYVNKYTKSEIESKVNLDQRRSIALALLLGCSYNKDGVPGVNPSIAMKLLDELKDVDIIERFQEWRMNDKHPSHSLESQIYTAHCEVCFHPGSLREHRQSGCAYCPDVYTCYSSDGECPCDYHANLRSKEKWEIEVREKSLRIPDFPFINIIKEYLEFADKLPVGPIEWPSFNLPSFQNFAQKELKWDFEKSLGKAVPLLAIWQLTALSKSADKSKSLLDSMLLHPTRIHVVIRHKGVSFLKVEWLLTDSNISSNVKHITTVPQSLFCDVYSDPDIIFRNMINKRPETPYSTNNNHETSSNVVEHKQTAGKRKLNDEASDFLKLMIPVIKLVKCDSPQLPSAQHTVNGAHCHQSSETNICNDRLPNKLEMVPTVQLERLMM